MEVVAIINYKGGVGKTTVTANLAGELAFRGKKVLLIDTDAQASLTFSFITPDRWDDECKESKTIKSWFDAISGETQPQPLSDFVITPPNANEKVKSKNGRIDLICSHLGLINVDLELAVLLGGANITQSKQKYLKVHGKLREAIQHLSSISDYDYVLIDCPPNFNIVTKNAILASEKILIPAKPDYLSTLGIDYLMRSMKELLTEYNEYVTIDNDKVKICTEILGVIFTMIQFNGKEPISAQRQYISQTSRLGITVFKSNFRENKSIFAEAAQKGVPVVLQSYTNPTHSQFIPEIKQFVDEFLAKLKEE